jgi:Tfp pilus assembly protein PilW
MRYARIDRSADESGTTVVELVITTAILLVITASLFSLMINLSRADVRTGAIANNADAVRVVSERVARDIRASNPLLATDSVTGHAQWPSSFS